MEILKITENENGSSTLDIDMTEEEMRLLMEAGLNKVLKDYCEEFDKKLEEGGDPIAELKEDLKK